MASFSRNEGLGEAAGAMARGVFEFMKTPGCLKGCWCGGRWFDRLTMTDGEGGAARYLDDRDAADSSGISGMIIGGLFFCWVSV